VEQHICHAALAKYCVTPLEETMKIHYFEDGISDSSFASVKCTTMVDRQKFQNVDAVMQLYLNFKHLQKAEALTYQARNVSALQGCRGGRQGHGGCGSGRRGGPNSCVQGLVPQDEINRQTHIVNKHYSTSEYNKFTLAEKARLWQLKDPWKDPWDWTLWQKNPTELGHCGRIDYCH
jgi:hypothetical protein